MYRKVVLVAVVLQRSDFRMMNYLRMGGYKRKVQIVLIRKCQKRKLL